MKINTTLPKEKNLPKGFVRVAFNESTQTEWLRDATGTHSLSVGLGAKRSEISLREVRIAMRKVINSAKNARVKQIALDRNEIKFSKVKLSDKALGELVAIEFELANFEFVKYKSEPKEGWNFVESILITGSTTADFRKGLVRGAAIAQEVNETRILANTPGGEMTPEKLAQAAREAVKGTKAATKVLDVSAMESLGMGAVLGVGAGSADAPCFIVMEYFGGAKKDRPIVLVGKGVTFDTGGLNLKPSDAMYEMHMDMSGGAAVIHTIALAARLGLKKNIIGLIPAVENMPSGSSYHPGDVLRSMSGKTIEILNTDAEGRVILADALFYAGRYNPKLVVDVATLTGAAMVAFGNKASAIFTKDAKLENVVRGLGEASGDYVWPMPLWDEYEADIKGTFGDWANMGKGRNGGAIAGAMFLKQFTTEYPKDTKWLHIDMAPRMTSYEGEQLAKGAVGAPVRLLLAILENTK